MDSHEDSTSEHGTPSTSRQNRKGCSKGKILTPIVTMNLVRKCQKIRNLVHLLRQRKFIIQ